MGSSRTRHVSFLKNVKVSGQNSVPKSRELWLYSPRPNFPDAQGPPSWKLKGDCCLPTGGKHPGLAQHRSGHLPKPEPGRLQLLLCKRVTCPSSRRHHRPLGQLSGHGNRPGRPLSQNASTSPGYLRHRGEEDLAGILGTKSGHCHDVLLCVIL